MIWGGFSDKAENPRARRHFCLLSSIRQHHDFVTLTSLRQHYHPPTRRIPDEIPSRYQQVARHISNNHVPSQRRAASEDIEIKILNRLTHHSTLHLLQNRLIPYPPVAVLQAVHSIPRATRCQPSRVLHASRDDTKQRERTLTEKVPTFPAH